MGVAVKHGLMYTIGRVVVSLYYLRTFPMSMPTPVVAPSPRLLDQLRQAALQRFGRTEPGERYASWVRRYILFHARRHLRELGPGDVSSFLEHVAKTEKDPLRCLEQAHEALVFLYEGMLHLRLGEVSLPQPAS